MEFETPEDVEDQDPVGYWAAEVVKGVGHALHPPAVLPDRDVALLESAERGVEPESAGLGVAEELRLERQPGLAGSAAASPDDVLKI